MFSQLKKHVDAIEVLDEVDTEAHSIAAVGNIEWKGSDWVFDQVAGMATDL